MDMQCEQPNDRAEASSARPPDPRRSRPAALSVAAVLPGRVAVCERRRSLADAPLHPAEEAQIATRNMAREREREFRAGRFCAHRAMAGLSGRNEPVLTGPDRAPIWPTGLIGSITHCAGYCAAAVAYAGDFRSIGIDAELWRNFPTEVAKDIASDDELNQSTLASLDRRLALALVFSAKESIYKSVNPIIKTFFDFHSVSIRLSTEDCSFKIDTTTIGQLHGLKNNLFGKFVNDGNMVICGATVAHHQKTFGNADRS